MSIRNLKNICKLNKFTIKVGLSRPHFNMGMSLISFKTNGFKTKHYLCKSKILDEAQLYTDYSMW